MKLPLAAALVALSALAAHAAPFAPPSAEAVAPSTSLERVHFGHGSCQLGRAGWHFHTWRGERIPCRPFRRYYR